MLSRAVLFLGAVLLGILLLMQHPTPMAIAPSEPQPTPMAIAPSEPQPGRADAGTTG